MKDKIPALVALTAFASMAMYGTNVDGTTPSMLQECMKNLGFGLGSHILAQEGLNKLLLYKVSEKDFLNHDLQETFKRASPDSSGMNAQGFGPQVEKTCGRSIGCIHRNG